MQSKMLLACLLLGLAVVAHAAPASLDDLYEGREARSIHDRDDDDDDDDDDDYYEKRPYSFSWQASRHYHGAPDREHTEERGADGITRGVFRYVDPRLRVQEVIYTADENGFHILNPNPPEYTDAQIVARARHAQLFQQIADEHIKIGAEHSLQAAERGYELEPYVAPILKLEYSPVDSALLPQNTAVVERARTRHQELFERIAAQHARIAAERKTDPADQETGEPYEYQYDTPLKTVEVVFGSVGPSIVGRDARVIAPGSDHPDFQGYGVPLGTFRDDLTEEEALALLEEANERHLLLFQEEADNHETLVLSDMGGGFSRNQGKTSNHRQGQIDVGIHRPINVNPQGSGQDRNRKKNSNHRQGQIDVGIHRPINVNPQGSEQNRNRNQNQFRVQASENQQQYSSGQAQNVQAGRNHGNRNQHSPGQRNRDQNQSQFQPRKQNQRSIGQSGRSHGKTSSIGQNRVQYSTGQSSVSHTPNNKQNNRQQIQSLYRADNTKQATIQNQGRPLPNQPRNQNQGQQSSGIQHANKNQQRRQNQNQNQHSGRSVAPPRKNSNSNNHGGRNLNTRPQTTSGNYRQNKSAPRTSAQQSGNKRRNQQNLSSGNLRQQSGGQFKNRNAGISSRNQSGNRAQFSANRSQGSAARRDFSSDAHDEALAINAEYRREHLRQFKKIAEAHEQIGNEHIQLTLSALRSQRNKQQQNW